MHKLFLGTIREKMQFFFLKKSRWLRVKVVDYMRASIVLKSSILALTVNYCIVKFEHRFRCAPKSMHYILSYIVFRFLRMRLSYLCCFTFFLKIYIFPKNIFSCGLIYVEHLVIWERLTFEFLSLFF